MPPGVDLSLQQLGHRDGDGYGTHAVVGSLLATLVGLTGAILSGSLLFLGANDFVFLPKLTNPHFHDILDDTLVVTLFAQYE